MKPAQIAESAIQKINRRITDLVFLEIQNDRKLMQEYLRCIEEKGLNKTNQKIGETVKSSYGLYNAGDREGHPISTLIQSHQTFK